MIDKKNLTSTLSRLQKTSKPEDIRFGLCSVYTTLILSFDAFGSNKDLALFFSKEDITDIKGEPFREYVFRSRTAVLARTLRVIHDTQSTKVLLHMLEVAKRFVFEDNTYKDTTPKNNEPPTTGNKFDDLFRQFSSENNSGDPK